MIDSYVDVVRATGKEATQKRTQSGVADAATWYRLRWQSTSAWSLYFRTFSLPLNWGDSEEVIVHGTENGDSRESEKIFDEGLIRRPISVRPLKIEILLLSQDLMHVAKREGRRLNYEVLRLCIQTFRTIKILPSQLGWNAPLSSTTFGHSQSMTPRANVKHHQPLEFR